MLKLRTILFDYNNTLAYFPDDEQIIRFFKEADLPFYAELAQSYDLDLQDVVSKMDLLLMQQIQNARIKQELTQATLEVIVADTLAHNGLAASMDWVNTFAQSKYRSLCTLVQAAPGAINLLQILQKQGFQLGLVSNGFFPPHMIRQNLQYLGLLPFFAGCIFSQEVGYSKPDTRIFETALHLLNADPATTLVVGDELLNDIAPAQALHCWTVQTVQFIRDVSETIHPHATIEELTRLGPLVRDSNSLLLTRGS